MKISNDKITFAPEDFDGLSDFAKAALAVNRPKFAQQFGDLLTASIKLATDKFALTKGAPPAVADLLVKLADASPQKLDEIKAVLDRANLVPAAAEVVEFKPAAVAEAPVVEDEKPGLFARIVNVFK